MRSALAHLVLVAFLLGLAGCSDTFVPASVVEDFRVLTLVAVPPELGPPGAGPRQQVQVTAGVASPLPGLPHQPAAGDPAVETWTFCPFSAGPSAGYACAVPLCELPLDATDRTVTFDPVAEVETCAAALGASFSSAVPGGIPDRVEVLVRYRRVEAGQPTREAVQRIPVWTRQPPAGWAANRLPVITGVGIGAGQPAPPALPCPDPFDVTGCPSSGTVTAAAPLPIAVAVDPGSVDTYPDGSGRILTESVVVSFFTTAGRFSQERGEAPSATTTLEAKELGGATRALVWAVARDLRGGQAVTGPYLVTFAP